MGLTVYAKGLNAEQSYDCGYITFGVFRMLLAEIYNKECGEIYKKWYNSSMFGEKPTQEETDRLNELLSEGLKIFLGHSDYNGKFTPQECKKIYDEIKDLKMDMEGHNYGIMEPYNMLEQWKYIFKYCYKRRVNLYFS